MSIIVMITSVDFAKMIETNNSDSINEKVDFKAD